MIPKCIIFSNTKVAVMFRKLYHKLRTYFRHERCPRKLSFSVAVSVFIAFSPFVGFHTAMAFLFSWVFALNAGMLLAMSMSINNPWTMIPIYATDHVVGDGIFQLLGIDGMMLNPSWLSSFNAWLSQTVGMSGISVWAFVIGGNLLSILLAFSMYMVMRFVLAYRVQEV